MCAFAAALAAGTAAGVARAASPADPPPALGSAATSVYVEQIPTSSGSVAVGDSSSRSTKLDKALAGKIEAQGGSDAAAIKVLVTAASLGAPPAPAPAPARAPKSRAGTPAAASRQAAPSTAVAADSASGNTGRLIGLLVVLALLFTGLALFARRGRREGRNASPGS